MIIYFDKHILKIVTNFEVTKLLVVNGFISQKSGQTNKCLTALILLNIIILDFSQELNQ